MAEKPERFFVLKDNKHELTIDLEKIVAIASRLDERSISATLAGCIEPVVIDFNSVEVWSAVKTRLHTAWMAYAQRD